MTIELLTFTQIAAILVYVASVFFIYKLLGNQKDATIETLRAQNELLQHQLRLTEKNTPDVLAEILSNRIKTAYDELSRMKADKDSSSANIAAKERELETANLELATMAAQIARAEAVLEIYGCPRCNAPLLSTDVELDMDEFDERNDVEHTEVVYACGYTTYDNEVVYECINTPFNPKPSIA